MDFDEEIKETASQFTTPQLADLQDTFDALYCVWYLVFQQNPTLTRSPPIPDI